MSGISFSSDQEIKLFGRHGVVRYTLGDIVFIEFGKNEFKHFERQNLIDFANEQQLIFIDKSVEVRCFAAVTDKQAKEGERRLAYCEAFDSLKKYSDGDEAKSKLLEVYEAIKLVHSKKPSLKTVGKWLRVWRSHGKDINLQVVTSKAGGHRLSFEMEELVKSTINKHYLKTSRPTKTEAYLKLEKAYKNKIKDFLGQKLPCLRTFERYIEFSIPKYEVDLKRYGKKHANMENRVAAKMYNLFQPLELVEMDGAEFNIGLLNEDGSYAGKVTIFGLIDVFTRSLLGYTVQVGSVKESASAVIHTLSHSMRSKRDPSKYPMGGIALNYTFDNGPGFQAKMTKNFLNKLNVEYTYCRSRRATEKPFIERFWGTARTKFFSKCSGYLGKRKHQVIPEKTIKQAAKLTVNQFMVMWDDYVQNVYHHSPHSQINNWTPYEMWAEHAESDAIITMSDHDERLKLRGIATELTCTINYGVNHRRQRFHSEELAALVRQEVKNTGKDRVKLGVFIDYFDASALTVVDSSGRLINVPNVNQTIALDTSFSEIKAFVKQRKDEDFPDTISEQKAKNKVEKHRKKGSFVPSDSLILGKLTTEDEPVNEANMNSPLESTTSGKNDDAEVFSDEYEDD